MIFSRACRSLLIAMMVLMVSSGTSHATDRSAMSARKQSNSLSGTWYSTEGAITFRANGTINYEGKRYYYAFTNGGLIQLSRNGNNRTIPYQYSGGKLTLTVNGKPRVYSRRKR